MAFHPSTEGDVRARLSFLREVPLRLRRQPEAQPGHLRIIGADGVATVHVRFGSPAAGHPSSRRHVVEERRSYRNDPAPRLLAPRSARVYPGGCRPPADARGDAKGVRVQPTEEAGASSSREEDLRSGACAPKAGRLTRHVGGAARPSFGRQPSPYSASSDPMMTLLPLSRSRSGRGQHHLFAPKPAGRRRVTDEGP